MLFYLNILVVSRKSNKKINKKAGSSKGFSPKFVDAMTRIWANQLTPVMLPKLVPQWKWIWSTIPRWLTYTAWKVSVFGLVLVRIFCIRTEYIEIRSISPYSVRMRENRDQNNSEYWQFSRSVILILFYFYLYK